MVSSCIVPRCRRRRRTGLSYYRFPVRDVQRCKLWLRAVDNPKYDENTTVDCLKNHRVCSLHFKPDDFERHLVWEEMGGEGVRKLRPTAVPSLNLGDGRTCADAERGPVKSTTTAVQSSASRVSGPSVFPWTSVLTSIHSEPLISSRQSPPVPEPRQSLCNVSPVDCLNESVQKEAELRCTTESDDNTEKDQSQSKTIVNDNSLMELFKKCQTCGQTIIKTNVSHLGAQKKVRWSCLGGHRGIWVSSPHLWESFPEINLLTAFSILFSGGPFTHFKNWAKHLHLHFIGNQTFFEVQKAYLNPEIKPMNRTKEGGSCIQWVHQPEDTLLHIADPLKKMKAKLSRRERRSVSSYEKRSQISETSTGADVPGLTAPSSCGLLSHSEKGKQNEQDDVHHQRKTTEEAFLHDSFEEMEVTLEDDIEDEGNSVKNRISDLESDMENDTETPKQRSTGADESCDEDVYVSVIPQRSSTSELLLECEEEELEPWQKQSSPIDLKEADFGVLKEESDRNSEPTTSASSAGNASPPELKTETTQPVVFNIPGFIVASPQIMGNTELTRPQCPPGNPFTILPAGHQQLFQKVTAPTVTPDGATQSNEVQQVSNNPVSLSRLQTPAVYATSSTNLQADQSSSHGLPVAFSMPCIPYLNLNQVTPQKKT